MGISWRNSGLENALVKDRPRADRRTEVEALSRRDKRDKSRSSLCFSTIEPSLRFILNKLVRILGFPALWPSLKERLSNAQTHSDR